MDRRVAGGGDVTAALIRLIYLHRVPAICPELFLSLPTAGGFSPVFLRVFGRGRGARRQRPSLTHRLYIWAPF